MFRKNSLAYILIYILSFLIVSCVPAQVIPTLQQPVSTSNPNMFSTMVAGTAGAFMTQTKEAIPTQTPTSPPPTKTLLPTVTATPTDSGDKTSLSVMEDDSTQFFDYQAGIKLIIPAGWLAVRLGEQEFLNAKNDAANDPVLQSSLESVQGLDSVIYRLHAFNTGDGYVSEGEGSSVVVVFIKGDSQELELIAEAEVQPKDFKGYELITSGYQVRVDSLEIFTLEETWEGISTTKQPVTLFHKRIVFKVATGTMYIDLNIPLQSKDKVLPEFNMMIEQLSIFAP